MSRPTDRDHVTLFRGAADNPYFEVFFDTTPEPGADEIQVEVLEVEVRGCKLHVEIYNPEGTIPFIITCGGMGDCDGFRGFARNVATSSRDLRVIIYDRRNLGRSEVAFGAEPLIHEEAEDLHVLIQKLGVGPATLFGMSSGGRSNLVLADRYPGDIAAMVIAPLTGGPIAAARLSDEYYLKYLKEDISTMEDVAKTPLWANYVSKNPAQRNELFMSQKAEEFLATMKRAGEHLQSFADQLVLGVTDEQLFNLKVPELLVLHHGAPRDDLHPLETSAEAVALIPNSTFQIAPTLAAMMELCLPLARRSHARQVSAAAQARSRL